MPHRVHIPFAMYLDRIQHDQTQKYAYYLSCELLLPVMIGIGANHWHCQDRRPWPMAGRLGQPSEPSIAGADLDPWPPFPQVTSDTSNMGKCTFLSIMDGLAPWREI